jgi:hypothetical protein
LAQALRRRVLARAGEKGLAALLARLSPFSLAALLARPMPE